MTTLSYTHITRDERIQIESHLNQGNASLKILAAQLCRSPKAIRNELKKHRYIVVRENRRNKCGRQLYCKRQHLCDDCENGLCKACRHRYCNDNCPDYISVPDCKRTNHYPFVCNGCADCGNCPLPKYIYNADKAQSEAIETAIKQRGMNRTSPTIITQIDAAVSQGLAKGLSIEVIVNEYKLPISVSTVYRLIDEGRLPNVSNIDLKRKVRYKVKKPKASSQRPDPSRKIGRTFKDYMDYLASQPSDLPLWQMDTVLGKIGKEEKCVLTLLHVQSNLQLYFLLQTHTSGAVSSCISSIRHFLGDELFKNTFPIILTDNGTEFSNVDCIERSDLTGEQLIHVFYCDPYQSQQKSKCEKNHEHFREMVPKGKSMNSLTQKSIDFVSGNVNNYPRPKLNFYSPYKIALMMLNKKVLELNRLIEIPVQSINLLPII